MRVLFDAFWWGSGPIANRTVLRELIFAWRRIAPADEMILATRGTEVDQSDLPARTIAAQSRLFPHAAVNLFELPLLAKRHRADIIVAHNYTPLTGTSSVFIHDLLFEEHPEWFSLKERAYFAPMGRLASRAAHVATSSRTEAERIRRRHPRIKHVEPIGLAASPHLTTAAPTPLPEIARLPGFVLSVGRLNARKNLGTVIEGAMSAATVTSDRPLVVVGSSEYSGAGADLPRSVSDHVADGRIVFLGRVSDGELRWLYENADGLIFLSLDEGFGLPPVEARRFGAPVIASDIAVMREVAGADAMFVSPHASSEVATAIDRLSSRHAVHRERPTSAPEDEWNAIAQRWRDSIVARLRAGE